MLGLCVFPAVHVARPCGCESKAKLASAEAEFRILS